MYSYFGHYEEEDVNVDHCLLTLDQKEEMAENFVDFSLLDRAKLRRRVVSNKNCGRCRVFISSVKGHKRGTVRGRRKRAML